MASRQIDSMNFTVSYHLGENAAAERIFCKDQKPTCVTVETVDDPAGERLAFFGKVPGNAICKGIREMPL